MSDSSDKDNGLLAWYPDNSFIRALVQLIPVAGGSVDTLVSGSIQRIRDDRSKVFFDEMANGDIELTEDLIKNDDFLHKYFCTFKAAVNTRREKKIRLFAKLLKSSISKPERDVDEYEEILQIIDDLSYREFLLLWKLEEYRREQSDYSGDIYKQREFESEFLEKVCKELKVEEGVLAGMLTRLERSGCYSNLSGDGLGYSSKIGHLTDLYFNLREFIGDYDENK